ncbi:MAG TPA: HdeD family acid-resistance protein, partial [Anaerolineae bacterium]|nr:HdeD family acid-resistance protein [Anaerolineae bacterium]
MVGARDDLVIIPWWLVLIEGIASVIVGAFLLFKPGMTLIVLIQVMGIFWLVGGIFRLIGIFMDRSMWGWKLVGGIIGILAGISVLSYPLWSAVMVPTVFVIVIGVQGLIMGVVTLIMAFKGGGWGPGILGALSIVFGIILLGNPLAGALVLPIVA